MVPYLITFLISILLCGLAELTLKRSRTGGVLLLGAAVLPPVFLAGARDFEVGTDIRAYGNYVFTYARFSSNPISFMWRKSDIEPFYKGLAAFVSRFTDNPHWFYFATALIICGCIMGGLYHYRRFCSITLSWACFLFLFYGDTLNTMRQCLALAVVFWSFPFFLKKKYALYILFQAAAVLFHTTGCIALVFPLLYLFLRKVPMQWVQFFFVIFCMGLVMFYSPLLRTVLKTGLLPGKFYRYLAKGAAVAVNPTVLRLPLLVPILLYYDRFCNFQAAEAALVPPARGRDPEGSDQEVPGVFPKEESIPGMLIVLMLLMEICTVQLRSVMPALYRISYYFGSFRFIAYSRLPGILRKDNRNLVIVLLFLYLLVLWVYQNVMQGNNGIYPYQAAQGWWHLHYGLASPFLK